MTVCLNIKTSLMNKMTFNATTCTTVISPFLTKLHGHKSQKISVKNSTKRRQRLIHQLDFVTIEFKAKETDRAETKG